MCKEKEDIELIVEDTVPGKMSESTKRWLLEIQPLETIDDNVTPLKGVIAFSSLDNSIANRDASSPTSNNAHHGVIGVRFDVATSLLYIKSSHYDMVYSRNGRYFDQRFVQHACGTLPAPVQAEPVLPNIQIAVVHMHRNMFVSNIAAREGSALREQLLGVMLQINSK